MATPAELYKHAQLGHLHNALAQHHNAVSASHGAAVSKARSPRSIAKHSSLEEKHGDLYQKHAQRAADHTHFSRELPAHALKQYQHEAGNGLGKPGTKEFNTKEAARRIKAISKNGASAFGAASERVKGQSTDHFDNTPKQFESHAGIVRPAVSHEGLQHLKAGILHNSLARHHRKFAQAFKLKAKRVNLKPATREKHLDRARQHLDAAAKREVAGAHHIADAVKHGADARTVASVERTMERRFGTAGTKNFNHEGAKAHIARLAGK